MIVLISKQVKMLENLSDDPNGYFEDANLIACMPLQKNTNVVDKDIVIAGYGPGVFI